MIPLSDSFKNSLRTLPATDSGSLIDALDTPPVVSLRFNRRKAMADNDFENLTPVAWCADGRYLAERPVFTLDPNLHAGAYYVQDASSMIYQQITGKLADKLQKEGFDRNLTILDFCAAPGGKTTAIINAVSDGTTVVANEYVAARGKILRENLEKWGYPYVITTGCSSEQYASLPEMFDIIAVDAPCSGEGMMRKDDEARRQWNESLIDSCAELQRKILSDLSSALRPGGYLIYSTCTFNLEEDERNSLFISEQLGFEPVNIDSLNLTGTDTPARALLPGTEGLRFMPHLTRGEGLYVSVFRKPEEEEADESEEDSVGTGSYTYRPAPLRSRGNGHRKKGKTSGTELNEALKRELRSRIRPDVIPRFDISGTMVTMMPESTAEIAETLRRYGINVTGAGLPMAELKITPRHTDIIPDSRFALNLAMDEDAYPRADLNREEAMRFLRRESFALQENIPRGYVVVTYKGLPLGMMKNLGNRANNLHPSAWRVKI